MVDHDATVPCGLPPLTTETIWAILQDKIDDATATQLVWHCLGYRYDLDHNRWDDSNVSPTWRSDYPNPPDFMANRPATVKLTRSIPPAHKQLLKQKLGFQGYKVGELTPRLTRRATLANWLLSYLQSQESSPQNL